MATPNYDINYNDKRFTQVTSDKNQALSDLEQTYSGMINQSDAYYQNLIDANQKWADRQTELQQEQTDFAIEKIEYEKEQAKKDYLKEQSGAYVDWQKQSNQYGANAEQMAAQGLAGSGYSESSQVSMYNTYQNRITTARESYNQAVVDYNMMIKDARLQNNAALAEIAYNALQQRLELALEGFQYKNQLIIEQSNKKLEVENMYYNRYQDVLAQINTENALAENIRQYNESLAEEKRQYNESLALEKAQLAEEQRQFNETMAYNKAKAASSSSSSSIKKSSSSSGSKSSSSVSKNGSNRGIGMSAVSVVNKDDTDKSSSTGTSGSKIDMVSVLELGYGPISAAKLNQLCAQGLVEEYTVNGVTKFRKSTYTNKMFNLMG